MLERAGIFFHARRGLARVRAALQGATRESGVERRHKFFTSTQTNNGTGGLGNTREGGEDGTIARGKRGLAWSV